MRNIKFSKKIYLRKMLEVLPWLVTLGTMLYSLKMASLIILFHMRYFMFAIEYFLTKE